MQDAIIVNATSLNESGALIVLNQFVSHIPENRYQWLVFVSERILITPRQYNVRIEQIAGVKSMLNRFLWDIYGLNKWIKRKSINPIACISLQNTGFRVNKKNIHKFLYFHQSLSLSSDYQWNPFDKEQRILWFYKCIYPLFVRLSLTKNTHVFVQLDFIKHGFAKKYKYPLKDIHTFSPAVLPIDAEPASDLDVSRLNLFYPATDYLYKNHATLFQAIKIADKNVKLYLTAVENDSGCKNVHCLNTIPHPQIYSIYKACDALVFPSYMESYGLPLIEAAMIGLPIIAADLPYAREVLEGYDGVQFVQYDAVQKWKEAIESLQKGQRYKPIDISQRQSWKEMFEYIENTIG